MCAFLAFIIGHVALVVIADFPRHMAYIIHGQPASSQALSVEIGIAGLVVVVLLHVWATRISWRSPRWVQRSLGSVVERVRCLFFHHVEPRQHYAKSDMSPYLMVNGYPPTSPEYARLSETGFADWRLSVSGLVEWPLQLSLDDLLAMPSQTQITKHNCIQGWSGVPMADILDRCHPSPDAHFLLLRGYDEHEPGKPYYETIDLELARHNQTILAYALNGEPLPVPHGAPCRLRVETQLGFKMVKYLRSIELVAEYDAFGDGQGGYREDAQFYDQTAGI